MTPVSVLTIVKNRADHLAALVDGLRRSTMSPHELIVIDMSDVPVTIADTGFPVTLRRFEVGGLPLAAARNRAAAAATAPHLLFLDVDCIPLSACLARMAEELERADALLCADIRYLGPSEEGADGSDAALLARGRAHPVRAFPQGGVRREPDAGLFWSLAFAIRAARFAALGGFDEAFAGYGAEDTDFGFRAAEAGVPLLFVGGAIACHQHHGGHQPPVQHLDDILRNAALFQRRWGRWPMQGWLDDFAAMGLVRWRDGIPVRVRTVDDTDLARTAITTPF